MTLSIYSACTLSVLIIRHSQLNVFYSESKLLRHQLLRGQESTLVL